VQAFGATPEDHRVAGLETERAGIGGHVGSAFVDDADDPERHRDAGDAQAIRPAPLGERAPDRILERGNVLDAARHRLDARRIETQTIEHGRRQLPRLGGPQVERIGLEQRGYQAAQRRRGGTQRLILALARGPRQHRLCSPRCATDFAHERRKRGVALRQTHCITRSSRCTSSSRPAKPSNAGISALRRPQMRDASTSE
jgi:hypothetical protein